MVRAKIDLEKKIKIKEKEIFDLEHRLQTARTQLEAYTEVLMLFPKDAERLKQVNLRSNVMTEIRDFLRKKKKPMHLKSILQSLGKDVSPNSIRSLGSQINAYVRDSEIFTRPSPGSYGLVEFGQKGKEELPETFGRFTTNTSTLQQKNVK